MQKIVPNYSGFNDNFTEKTTDLPSCCAQDYVGIEGALDLDWGIRAKT